LSRSIKCGESSGEAGFTIIEALVALVVVAVSLAAIGSVVAANVRNTHTVESRLDLLQTARGIVAGLPDRGALKPGDLRGQSGDYSWRVDVMPFAADFVDPAASTPWVPQAVVVRVEAPSGEILRLDTVRLRRRGGDQ
jgi:general secretion pathway protein I